MAKTQPYLIESDSASGRPLYHLPSQDKVFKEEWLQSLIYNHPSILPLEDIDEAFVPAISIGREIYNIDNLFISPSGFITIVETKLWRNPEAHRTVVAQILEYAATLSKLSYKQLDDAVQVFMKTQYGEPKSIYKIVKSEKKGVELNEIEFQQRVQDCLADGQFALLIVGDKIFPEATQLVEIIQSAPHMHYTIGFVELQCYKLEKESNWPLVIFPHFVSKTNEITRAVVKVIYEEKRPEIEIDTPAEEHTSVGHVTFSELIASLPSSVSDIFKTYIERWMNLRYIIFWGQAGFSLRVICRGKPATIFEAYPKNAGILKEKRVAKYGIPEEPYREYREQLMKSHVFSSAFASGGGHIRYINYDEMSNDDIVLLLDATDKLAHDITNLRNATS